MIEIRLLSYFLAIAREQSITRAAESLHVSQPTLSKQMMELEEQLGTQLLIRGRKRVTLTEDGEYLRKSAQEIIALMEKTESSFQESARGVGGDIYLACGESAGMGFLAEVYHELLTDYPDIRLHIHSGDADTITERLDKGLADLGLFHGPIQNDKYDFIPLPIRDSFGLLMPEDCPLAEKEVIDRRELSRLPLIFPDQLFRSGRQLDWFGTHYPSFHIAATYNLVFNAAFLVEQGIGYALCFHRLAGNSTSRPLVFRPIVPELSAGLCLAAKKYQAFSPAVKLFLEYLRRKIQ